jgi:aconitate hydratase A / 2-methylisocitrate dehydratase
MPDMLALKDLLSPTDLTAYRRLPRSLRILVENALRNGYREDADLLLRRTAAAIRVTPTRLVMQDLLAVPLLADLASLRTELAARGANPRVINPRLPTDLVIDHSMTVFYHGTPDARRRNEQREIEINRERFVFLRWCAQAFENLRVIPPGNGIVHQINLEELATCAVQDLSDGSERVYPELVIGNDSHTPMINGLGILGWGVGGLEAEAALLGRPLEILTPAVVGVRLSGCLQAGASATDLALYMTELMRKVGVVDQFVEFFGPALPALSVADRATVSNMAPEYGATCAYFPIDCRTLEYLRTNGRPQELIDRVDRMAKQLELWDDGNESLGFDRVIELDLDTVRPSVAGPARPQDRVPLERVPQVFRSFCPHDRRTDVPDISRSIGDGDIIIAAITSCTNTANPRAMVQAGLLARNAVNRGLSRRSGIKTSFAPGSLKVASYLAKCGLQPYLDALGFNLVGFACTTCNGMSGPIEPGIAEIIERDELSCVAVLSGNRNFPGRIHPHAQANFIMSPALVIAYALAGSARCDLTHDPVGVARDGRPVYLADIWPHEGEVDYLLSAEAAQSASERNIAASAESREAWEALSFACDDLYAWNAESTYIQPSPYFRSSSVSTAAAQLSQLRDLRPIVVLGDAINTDHIAPVGFIASTSAAGRYLTARGIALSDFNSYGTRRASSDIVARSFFANHRLNNQLANGKAGSFTRILPDGEIVPLYNAVEHYARMGTGLIIIGGAEYGCGSSRDTAAKACYLAGVRAVLAKSFERIHRSNLINMGIWPLVFVGAESADTLGLVDAVSLSLELLPQHFAARMTGTVSATKKDGSARTFEVEFKVATANELVTLFSGGLLAETLAQVQGQSPSLSKT